MSRWTITGAEATAPIAKGQDPKIAAAAARFAAADTDFALVTLDDRGEQELRVEPSRAELDKAYDAILANPEHGTLGARPVRFLASFDRTDKALAATNVENELPAAFVNADFLSAPRQVVHKGPIAAITAVAAAAGLAILAAGRKHQRGGA